MAEILSLVGSVIAVVQAGDRLLSLLDKVRPFFNAPKDINLLVSEVSSFKGILIDLQAVIDHGASLVPVQMTSNVNKNMQEGREILTELDTLVGTSFIRFRRTISGDLGKANRIAWMMKLHDVEHLRQRLQDVKMNVLIQLGAIQTMRHLTTKQSIENAARSVDTITHSIASQLFEKWDIQQQTIKLHFEEFSDHIATLLNPIHSRPLGQYIDVDEYDPHSDDLLIQEAVLPGFSAQLISLRALKLRVEQHYYCNKFCSCSCHSKSYFSRPALMPNFFGSLRISWSLPYRSRCNQDRCRKRSKSLLDFHYQFPRWCVERVLFLSFSFSEQKGPEFVLRVLNVRPYRTAEIFRLVETDRVDDVHLSLTNNQASMLDISDYWEMSLLTHALQAGSVKVAKYLILSGADLFHKEKCGRTPWDFLWTFILGKESKVGGFFEQLSSLVPDIDVMARNDFTILHKIVLQLHGGDLETELRRSPIGMIDSKDMWGRTALRWAAVLGDIKSTLLLLQAGADPNIRDYYGHSPLEGSLWSNKTSCALVLLHNGNDIITINPWYGDSALHSLAGIVGGDVKFLSPIPVLDGNGVDTGARKSILIEMLDQGADINARTIVLGYSPFVYAISHNNTGIAEVLLHRGADFQYIQSDGQSLLHIAAIYGNPETLQMLHSHSLRGLAIDGKDSKGKTPLDYAEERADIDSKWVISWCELLEGIMKTDKDEENNVGLYENTEKSCIDIFQQVDYGYEGNDGNGDKDEDEEEEQFADALEKL